MKNRSKRRSGAENIYEVESLRAFVADIQGEKTLDRSLGRGFTVQETVLRAAGLK